MTSEGKGAIKMTQPQNTVLASAHDFAALDTIQQTFGLLENWEERYGYLIDLGKRLPVFPAACRTETHLVKGCTAQVWMVPIEKPADPESIFFLADSDAAIVRGLIALLMAIYQGKPKAQASKIPIEAIFSTLGLDNHLSPNRRNGFFAMVERIKGL
jgi:cysteine desulfuration protein SufE